MLARLERARAYEQQPDVFAVSINGAFPNADIAEVGASVNYAVLPFAKVPRPVFPLDREIDIADWLANNNRGVYIPAQLAHRDPFDRFGAHKPERT